MGKIYDYLCEATPTYAHRDAYQDKFGLKSNSNKTNAIPLSERTQTDLNRWLLHLRRGHSCLIRKSCGNTYGWTVHCRDTAHHPARFHPFLPQNALLLWPQEPSHILVPCTPRQHWEGSSGRRILSPTCCRRRPPLGRSSEMAPLVLCCHSLYVGQIGSSSWWFLDDSNHWMKMFLGADQRLRKTLYLQAGTSSVDLQQKNSSLFILLPT